MKSVVLWRCACYVDPRPAVAGTPTTGTTPMPKLWMLDGCWIAARGAEAVRVQVSAMFDTGNDSTIVKPSKVRELERLLGGKKQLPIFARHAYGEFGTKAPAYDLIFSFPDHGGPGSSRVGDSYGSAYGTIAPTSWLFDFADVWIGQDIFSQLVCTFDGVEGVLTVLGA